MTLQSSIRLAAVFLVLLVPVTLPAQTAADPLHTASRQELDVIKVLLAQEAAWNKGDLTAFASGYKDSPDTLFIGHQLSRGYAGMVDQYKRDYPTRAAMGTLSFTDLEVHPLDENFAVCIGKYHLDRAKKDGGNAGGIFSLVLEKTTDGWRIIVDHTTS
ncbi:YybH family protein [Tunturiibacter gelidoferens]|uniref:Ketosteroid isomerase-like protein n=1 Tax=Tunturiibacter gelidiferens TaxID=3069689 RepID=A0A9X0QBX5_9BACT|nr:nuclear transport factor 2 family protein [Edaphobacter lichenicola]MBB5327539.1 ketosteroid isomerase-like protein [Edaphobacter lichenicola]